MIKLEQLISAEKNAVLDLASCTIVSEEITNDFSKFILEKDGKYYFREEQEGKQISCFEIIPSWKPFPHVTVFAFTPDNLHTYEVESGRKSFGYFEVRQLGNDQIFPGMTCTYRNDTLEYEDESHVKFNGKSILIKPDSGYTYRGLKKSIRARDGAKGFFRFMENIAEQSKQNPYPVFCFAWEALFKKYASV